MSHRNSTICDFTLVCFASFPGERMDRRGPLGWFLGCPWAWEGGTLGIISLDKQGN